MIIRTKDRPRLLARALKDVIAQDHEDWELVVVNDGGDPAAVDLLIAGLPSLRSRARTIHHAESLGMESASNHGVAETTGDYIAIHDDDDTWAPDFLSAAVRWLDERPSDVAVAAATEIVIERLEDDRIVELERREFRPPHDLITAFDLIVVNRLVPISLLTRRAVLTELGGFDDSLSVVGDWEFHLRLALHGHIGYLPQPVRAFWHQRPESTGDLSNSVHGARDLHGQFDRLIRDRALRSYAEEHGIGGLLYLSKFIDERIAASERHTYEKVRDAIEAHRAEITAAEQRMQSALIEAIRYHSLGATVRRNIGRLLRRRG
ncbi:glycosyltransferase family 2 protein [Microbacterium suwonense]|uniref:Glycosyltransferase 2-like domain-containing protein n=1 Tax=Microbacterium suwonense TaxID=683047 RepID=A0ABM8FTG0_9MICO|nr:glycosyltransferase family 2 protein [Microbacterium suwonense]BDZ38781.1 hypothetical protein GCM10025863_13950 [Microbacterium suwonense]